MKKIFRTSFLFAVPVLLAAGCHSIELAAPADGAEVLLLRSDWKKLIAQRGARPRLSEEKLDLCDRFDRPAPVVFRWEKQPGDMVLEIARDKKMQQIVRRVNVTDENRAEVANLEVGRTYYWRVRAMEGSDDSEVRSFVTNGDTPRYLAVPGKMPVNLRDAGGKVTCDGKRTAQGKVFRGSAMQDFYAIQEPARKFMREELKIKTDLDLRYAAQTAKYHESALGKNVKWLKFPVNAYKSFTPEQNELFRDAIKVFAKAENYPVYVHCAAGVDRTGEIIFLLDMILGVEEERAFLDYEASSLAYYPRQRTIPYFRNWLNTIEKMSPEGTPRREQVLHYLRSIGVTDEDMDAIRANMLEQ